MRCDQCGCPVVECTGCCRRRGGRRCRRCARAGQTLCIRACQGSTGYGRSTICAQSSQWWVNNYSIISLKWNIRGSPIRSWSRDCRRRPDREVLAGCEHLIDVAIENSQILSFNSFQEMKRTTHSRTRVYSHRCGLRLAPKRYNQVIIWLWLTRQERSVTRQSTAIPWRGRCLRWRKSCERRYWWVR